MKGLPAVSGRAGREDTGTLPIATGAFPVEGEPASFDVRQVFETIRQRWLTVVLVLLLVAGPGMYVVSQEVALYHATATIRLRDLQREMTGGLAGVGVGDIARGIDPVRSQIEVMTSRAVAEEVVHSTPELRMEVTGFPVHFLRNVVLSPEVGADSIGLVFTSTAVSASSPRGAAMVSYGDTVRLDGVRFVVDTRPAARGVLRIRPAESAVDGLMGRLQVRPRQNTDVIDVTYPDPDPTRARAVVNSVVSVFQSSNAAAAQRASVLRREFLEGQLKYHDSVLNTARAQLSLFRGRQRAYSTRARLSAEQQSLTELQLQRENLAADRRIYQDLLDALSRGAPNDQQIGAIMSAPGMAGNPVVTDLFGQLTRHQAKRDSLTTGRFGRPETNPEVQQLDGLIASAKSKLTGAVNSYVGTIDARLGALDRLRAQSSSSFPELSASEEEEASLEEDVEAARLTVSQLRGEYEKARLTEAVEVGQVEIVSLAALPRHPEGVSRMRKSAFFVLLGLVLGLGAALLAERLNTSVRRRGQVEKTLHLSELAVIPAVAPSRMRSMSGGKRDGRVRPSLLRQGQNGTSAMPDRLGDGLVVASDVHSIAAEAYRLLRTNLLFSLSSGSPRTVLITSAAPGEGKTTVAANLAIAFAQQGMRVLLVDADMRRGRVNDLFRMSRDPGLSQVLSGEIALENAVRPTPVNGLCVVTTGRLPHSPAELIGADAMRKLLEDANQEYGIVVLDSPPVLAAADASVLSTIVDATIIVVRAGQTDQDEAQATIDQLTAVGGKVVGAVLNDPNAKLRSQGAYYYYGPAGKRS